MGSRFFFFFKPYAMLVDYPVQAILIDLVLFMNLDMKQFLGASTQEMRYSLKSFLSPSLCTFMFQETH